MKGVAILLLLSFVAMAAHAISTQEKKEKEALANIVGMLEDLKNEENGAGEDIGTNEKKTTNTEGKGDKVTIINDVPIKSDNDIVKRLAAKLEMAVMCANFTADEEDELDDIIGAVFPESPYDEEDNEEGAQVDKRNTYCSIRCSRRSSCDCYGPGCRCKCGWFRKAKCYKEIVTDIIKAVKPSGGGGGWWRGRR